MAIFGRFTQRAQRAISEAQQAALELKQPYVGTEHFLLGLLKEPGPLVGKLLPEQFDQPLRPGMIPVNFNFSGSTLFEFESPGIKPELTGTAFHHSIKDSFSGRPLEKVHRNHGIFGQSNIMNRQCNRNILHLPGVLPVMIMIVDDCPACGF